MSSIWPLASAVVAVAIGVISNWIPKPAKMPVFAAVGVLILFAAISFFVTARKDDRPTASPPLSSSKTSVQTTTTTAPQPAAQASFSAPLHNSELKVGTSISVAGMAFGLAPDETMWIVSSASGDAATRYLMKTGPVLIKDGSWNFPSGGLGTPSDIGYSINLHAILANTTCDAALDAEVARQGPELEGSFLLPDECLELSVVALSAVA